MKLVAGPAKISFRLLTEEEIKERGLEDLKAPFCYGLVTSLRWNFSYSIVDQVVILDINNAVKIDEDTYVMEERLILARFVENDSAEGRSFKGFRETNYF